jgi:serine/threonine protein kinase
MKECPVCESKLQRLSSAWNKKENVEKLKQTTNDIPLIPLDHLQCLSNLPIKSDPSSDFFKYKWSTSLVTLKRLRVKPNKSQMNNIKLEAALCFKMRHPNIVAFFGLTVDSDNYTGFVMEGADQGNLTENMETMTHEEMLKVSVCICEGLSYMHCNQIAHRDLKPESVLIFGNKTIAKISDFGISKIIQTTIVGTDMVGTPKYCAPEIMFKGIQVKLG